MAGVKGKSGRKPKSWRKAAVKYAMSRSAGEFAGYILAIATGKIAIKDIDWRMVDLAKFTINHELGLPTAKAEITGKDGQPLIPYDQLIILAAKAAEALPDATEKGFFPVETPVKLLQNPDQNANQDAGDAFQTLPQTIPQQAAARWAS